MKEDILIVSTWNSCAGLSIIGEQQTPVVALSRQSYSHSTELESLIKELTADLDDFSFSSLSKIGVISGPGSFTGLRIGLSFAAGITAALGIPLYSLPLVECLEYYLVQHPEEEELSAPLSKKERVVLRKSPEGLSVIIQERASTSPDLGEDSQLTRIALEAAAQLLIRQEGSAAQEPEPLHLLKPIYSRAFTARTKYGEDKTFF